MWSGVSFVLSYVPVMSQDHKCLDRIPPKTLDFDRKVSSRCDALCCPPGNPDICQGFSQVVCNGLGD